MSKRIPILAAALLCSSAVFVTAQTTTTTVTQTPTTVTKSVQHPDGSYTIIEYPVGKEVQLAFTPVSLTRSKAVGTILRDDNGTRVVLNVTDVPADVSAINVYAVDDAGVVTLLGPVALANGAGKFTATTPLSKFMLIAAPDESLTAYDPTAKIYFRSSVPEGFAVIPHATAAGVTTPTIVTTTPATVTTPTIVTTTPATVTTPTIVTTTPATVTTPTIVTTTPATVTKTVQNADGSYTIIEYPVGKEVQLAFTPVSLTRSKAVGTILRDDNGTRVVLNVTDVPADVSAINVYAVDDAGVVTLLGPVALANGAGKFTATTPLSKFMLIAAPDESLTAYDPTAKIYFRSSVPEGFAVIPHATAAGVTTPTIVTTTPATVTTPTIVTTTPATVTTPTIVTTTPATVTTPTIVTTTPATVTKTVQNADGSYTIIEYPVGKEVQLAFTPVALTKSKAVGTILRDDNGTRVVLNVTDVPADVSAINVFAVDDAGVVTLLGPVALANGAGKFTATTPLSKFMLIAAPDEGLTAYDPTAKIYFRSSVPEGFAVIPFTTSPVGETVGATTTPGTTSASTYTVPMLNIPAYKKGDDTKLKIDFTGAMSGARANVFIEPHKNGQETEVKMVFHELKDAPKGQAYILWAVSPDNQFFKLGQIVNVRDRNEAEIKANTSLADFGLLVTMEDLAAVKTVVIPAGPRLGVIQLIP